MTVGQEGTLTVALLDANQNPLSGRKLTLKAYRNNQLATDVTFGTVTESTTNAGSYTATFSSTKAGDVTIKATVEGATGFEVTGTGFKFNTTGIAPSTNSSITATNKEVTVGQNGTLKVNLVDANANPLGSNDYLKGYRNNTLDVGVVFGTVTEETNSPGTYTATFRSLVAGDVSIKATVEGAANFEIEGTGFKFNTNGIAPTNNSTISAANKDVTVGQNGTLTVSLVDANSNPLPGRTIQLKAYRNDAEVKDVTFGKITESTTTPGSYSATFTSVKAGAVVIKATVVGAAGFVLEGTGFNFNTNGIAPSAASTLTAASKDVTVNQDGTLTVNLVDENANPLSKRTLEFKAYRKGTLVNDVTFTNITESTTTAGTYTATFRSDVAGAVTIAVLVAGVPNFKIEDAGFNFNTTGVVPGSASSIISSNKNVTVGQNGNLEREVTGRELKRVER